MKLEWATKGKASVLVDGQFGSTGKGLMAAYLALISDDIDIATTNAGAQAGHTTKMRHKIRPQWPSEFVCFHLPTSAVVSDALAYINAGSIIDPTTIYTEVAACGVPWARIAIHPRAAVIRTADREAERDPTSETAKLASTQKGVGQALSNKIMRRAPLAGEAMAGDVNFKVIDLNGELRANQSVVVEVPQGLDLSLNHGYAYPYVTSRDCWVGSGLSDAGIHPSFLGPVAMVVRSFPIRVGDLYNEMGEKIGTSGPFWPESRELDWAQNFPGVEPERTTVTKRVRRIASWSDEQYIHALQMNRPTIVCLNFCNYYSSKFEFLQRVGRMQEIEIGVLRYLPTHVYGFGPYIEDVTRQLDRAVAWFEGGKF